MGASIYAYSVVEEWVLFFNQSLGRASEMTMKFLGISEKELVHWAARDQTLWNRYKKIVKLADNWVRSQQMLGGRVPDGFLDKSFLRLLVSRGLVTNKKALDKLRRRMEELKSTRNDDGLSEVTSEGRQLLLDFRELLEEFRGTGSDCSKPEQDTRQNAEGREKSHREANA